MVFLKSVPYTAALKPQQLAIAESYGFVNYINGGYVARMLAFGVTPCAAPRTGRVVARIRF
jgi:hypothetical protein